MTIIIDNIITPYEIARYNEIDKVMRANLEVWFSKRREINRNWQYLPKINFKYRFLDNKLLNLIKLLHNNRNKIDRIIVCGWDSFIYLYAFLFCQKNKIRFTLWSGSTLYEKSWLRTLTLPLVKFIISQSNDFIAYGTRAKEYLIWLGAKEDKIKIFLNSVDADYFNREALQLKKNKLKLREKYNLPENDTVFIYVGQLIRRKGILELIHAFAKLSSINKKIALIIVGEGELNKEIELFISKYPETKIKLVGYIQYNRLPEVYALSDALVLPSKEEIWGLVVNEALASEIPVLVSKFAGCSVDLINRDSGEIIEDISEDNIIAILRKFLVGKKYVISSQLISKMRNTIYAKNNFT